MIKRKQRWLNKTSDDIMEIESAKKENTIIKSTNIVKKLGDRCEQSNLYTKIYI